MRRDPVRPPLEPARRDCRQTAALGARPQSLSTDLRRPCGPSPGSATALLAHACPMRSLRCSSLHPDLGHLDRRISRRGFRPRLFGGYDGLVPRASANGIELEYQTFGDPGDQPLVLISGLATQMISWQESFCELLASRGFFVIRFDNRDVGLSTWMDGAGPPDIAAAFHGEGHPAYQLADMADDVACLLASLGIPAAHLVRASMRGFIGRLR